MVYDFSQHSAVLMAIQEQLQNIPVVVGMGIDLLEVARLEHTIQRHGSYFLDRIFTPREQQYCNNTFNPCVHYASRFCAKEAFVKALGWGISSRCSWLDMEVCHDGNGRPLLEISKNVYTHLPWERIISYLSLSDEKNYAQAAVVVLAPVKTLKSVLFGM